MDFPQIVRTLRAADYSAAHTTAVASLVFLCAKAFQHLPPRFDPFTLTAAAGSGSGDAPAGAAVAAAAASGGGGGGGADFSRQSTSQLSSTFAIEFEAITADLRTVLRSWPAPSKNHDVARQNAAAASKSAPLPPGVLAVPLVEAAQQWVDAFPPSAHGGEPALAEEARNVAVTAAVSAVGSNPAAVIQVVLGAAVLPHVSRDIARALQAMLRLVPTPPASAPKSYWAVAMLSFADTMLLKRGTMSSVATIQTAEALLRETINPSRGMLDPRCFAGTAAAAAAASPEATTKQTLLAAFTHLICAWASIVFDSARFRTHKHRRNVGLLASAAAQCTARRVTPLFSDSVRRLCNAILEHDSGELARFVVAYASGDDTVVDAVDEALTTTSIPYRQRHFVRGRFGLASALVFRASKQSAGSSPLRLPVAFIEAITESQPGLVAEVWPPVPCLVPSFVPHPPESAGSDSSSSNNNNNKPIVEFCAADAAVAEKVVDMVLERLPMMRTSAMSIRDLVAVSQFAVTPALFATQLRKSFGITAEKETMKWDTFFGAFISNSTNINPAVCEAVVAPAVASWWISAAPSTAACVADLAALAEETTSFFSGRCNSGNDKAALFLTLAAVVRATPSDVLAAALAGDKADAFVQCFRSALGSPSAVLLGAAWAAFGRFPVSFQTSSAIAPFLKPLAATQGITEAQRRTSLAYASPSLDLSALHANLLKEVENEIVLALPDAFLTLAFPGSAANVKLSDADDAADVKSWLASPDCIVALMQSLAPADIATAFDPASINPTAAVPASPKTPAAGSPGIKQQARVAEAQNALAWAVAQRAVSVAKTLAEAHLVCGPIVTLLCSKRGFIRELAARAILGTSRLHEVLMASGGGSGGGGKSRTRSRSRSRSSMAVAAMAAAAANSGDANASASSSSGILTAAPRALSSWKYLSSELLPYLDRRMGEQLAEAAASVSSAAADASGAAPGAYSPTTAAAAAAAAASITADLRPMGAATILGRGVMMHLGVADIGQLLAAVLTACSHPSIVGLDPYFEQPTCRLSGRYRPDCITPALRAVRAVFGPPIGGGASSKAENGARAAGRVVDPFAQALADNCVAVAQALCATMASTDATTTTTTTEAKRSAARAFALLQAYLDAEHQTATAMMLLGLLRDTSAKLASLDPFAKAAMQGDVATALTKIVDAELFKKGTLKLHDDRPPKGVKQDDWEDTKHRDAKLAAKARKERLDKIYETQLAAVLDRVAALLVPFAAVRYLAGIRSLVSLDAIAALLPFLMETAHNVRVGTNAEDDEGNIVDDADSEKNPAKAAEFRTLPLFAECAEDGAIALLRCTPLAPAAHAMVRVYQTLGRREILDDRDAAEANAFAKVLRASVTQMLPPELMPPLLLVAKRFFRVMKRRRGAKTISAPAQHQFLSVLASGFGDRNISGKRDAAELLFVVIENFFGLHRMALNSIVSLSGHMSVNEIEPLSRAVLCGSDLGREAAVAGLERFSKQFGLDSRIGGILASAACADEKPSVQNNAKALVAALKFAPEERDWPVVADLMQRYHESALAVSLLAKYAVTIAERCPGAVAEWLPAILVLPRLAAITTIDHLAEKLDVEGDIGSLDFLMTVIEDNTSDVATIRAASGAGARILQVCTDAAVKSVIEKVQPRLRKSTSTVANHRELHNGANIILLTALATRTNDDKELQYVLEEVVSMSSASQTGYVHKTACDCITKLAKAPSLRRSDKIVQIGTGALKSMMNATVYAKKKGHGYIFAGIAAGAGLLFLRKVDFLEQIQAASRDRQQQRIAAMILLECCCDIIGEMFEPYALVLTPLLIDGIAEKDEKISECADDAAKAFMRCMSEAGLHQLIPRLIHALSAERTSKKRAPALNLIGYTAFCSPKQLVATLPSIMQHIIDALCDANGAISKAAYHALRRVAGVVSNQEIKEHVEVLLEAMRNPAVETENALDALLYTKFFTRVDPASLAILAPVVLRGLSEQSSTIRGKAAQITGSLVKLVSEQKSLNAYAEEFARRLQVVVQDPIPGVRSTAAKAMANIASMISEDMEMSVITWALGLLANPRTSAERSGAAEALCEAIAKGGPARFAAMREEIERGLRGELPNTREGFVNVIVYAPSAFPESMFAPLLPTLFQWVLRGLGDTAEQVRIMALTAGSTIITGYGTRTLQFVLGPLVDGVTSEVSSTRQACLLLTSKLIVHLVQVLRRQHKLKNKEHGADSSSSSDDEDESKKKEKEGGDEEELNENEAAATVGAVSAREAERASGFSVLGALKETIGEEKFLRILAALHIARFEHNANVRAEVHTAWTIAVSSIRGAVQMCLPALIDMCVCFASSDNPECNDLAERILEFTCQRLHETLDPFVLNFSKQYNEATAAEEEAAAAAAAAAAGSGDDAAAAAADDTVLRRKIGALASMAEVIPCTDADRIQRLGPYLVSCVLNGLQHTDERVRTNAGAVFDRVSKLVGSKWIDSMVEQQLATSVVGVLELVRVRPVSSLASVFKAFGAKEEKDITPHDVRLLRGLIDLEDTRAELVKHYDRVSAMLIVAERRGLPEATEAMTDFAESLVFEYANAPIQDIARALKTPDSRAGAIRSAAAYFFGIRGKYVDIMEQVLRMVIHHVQDASADVRDVAARALQQMVTSLDSKAAQLFTSEEKADPLLAKGACGRYALGFLDVVQSSLAAIIQATLNPDERVFEPFTNPAVFETLFQHFFLKYIDHGKAPQKVQALEGLLQLLSHTKPEMVVPSLVSVGGKCVRFLTSKQEGVVLCATMNLVTFLMTINGGGKEVVFENTLAASLCAAMLCDSTEAKLLAGRVALRLVRKNTTNAEKLLGGISARKASIENDSHKASLSRFIAIVIRAAQLERKVISLGPLFALVRGYFESPDSVQVAAAAGSCVGTMLMNAAAVPDSDVATIAQAALTMSRGKTVAAVGGIACLAAILNQPKCMARVTAVFAPFAANLETAVQAVVENTSNDRVVAAWALRLAAGALQLLPESVVAGRKTTSDALVKTAQSLHKSDDMLHSALDFVVTSLPPAVAESGLGQKLNAAYHAKSRIADEIGYYDFDLEDESGTDTKYF